VAIADRAKLFADDGTQSSDNNGPDQTDSGQGKLGITVQAVPGNLASKLGIKGGVIVSSVRPGSFADELNLGQGAVISAINRHPITDEASYRSIVSGLKSGDDVVFEVRFPNSPDRGASVIGGTLP
ncbi:MAG TPA: PDZ domain-containing protein, partial [Acidobacteriaceae bacterium]|nr:PDZ domain-containing protein [Acidobacteriaceae bacterium]